ncbi:hypothetical protein K9O30_22675 [Clostridium bowmanii]|uniref:hypothetical protein n=1 Tax=Clostridium bowmanii TaxID=132925 RepID=UPI001CD252B7|nr:hypothetical protein [Clostridium bowmanii]MCA1076459.1 hypothetical protein [Clostridium bowmanii]
MKRQNIRKALIIISFLLFPITIYYFSPFLIIEGMTKGIITGSFILFTLNQVGYKKFVWFLLINRQRVASGTG